MNTVACKDKNPSSIFNAKSHQHNNWEIIYHLYGATTETVGDCTYPLLPGTVTIVPAGTAHAKFSEEGFNDFCVQARYLRLPVHPFTVSDTDGSIRVLMELMIKTIIRREQLYDAIADKLLEAICLEIRKNTESTPDSPFVDELKNTIYDNIGCASFDLTEVLGTYGFHPDHVRRRFREKTGMTPLAYLTELRINKAKMMLTDSSFVSIVDVAEKCGFRDSFYFSTCFKKAVGTSPMQYRSRGIVSDDTTPEFTCECP